MWWCVSPGGLWVKTGHGSIVGSSSSSEEWVWVFGLLRPRREAQNDRTANLTFQNWFKVVVLVLFGSKCLLGCCSRVCCKSWAQLLGTIALAPLLRACGNTFGHVSLTTKTRRPPVLGVVLRFSAAHPRHPLPKVVAESLGKWTCVYR